MKELSHEKRMARGGLLFLFVLSIFITSCLSGFLGKPSIVVREIIPIPRSLVEMNLLLEIEVQNPPF